MLDTDVILDFFLDRHPFSEHATQLIGLCETKKIKGFVTPVICSNLYYILRKHARHEKVIGHLTILLTITDVLAMDKDVVLNAINSGFKDFEDSLQHFAALKLGGIDAILTRNVRDFRKSEIGVLTPESYLKSFFNDV